MNKKIRNIISVLLTVMMLLVSVSSTSFATDGKISSEAISGEIIGNANKLTLKKNTGLSIKDTFLEGVGVKLNVSGLVSKFSNDNIQVSDSEGKKLSDSDIVGTGCVLSLMNGDTVLDSLTAVIAGDLTGDGIVDTTDYLRIKMKFLGTLDLSDAAYQAADVDGSGVVNSTDYMRVKGHFLGSYNLFPEVENDNSSEEPSSEESSEASSEDSSDESSEEPSNERTNYALNKKYTIGGYGYCLDGKGDDGIILTNGIIPQGEIAGSIVAFSGTGQTNTITIDLGKVYKDINEITVCSVIESGNRQYGTVTLEISDNGVIFTALSDYKEVCTSISTLSNYSYKLSSDVSARYVKISLTSKNYVLTVGEVEVYGGNAPAEPDTPSNPSVPSGTGTLYISSMGSIWTQDTTNSTFIVFPGQRVEGLYQYKLYAVYSDAVGGYVVTAKVGSHCSYSQTVESNGLGVVFSYDPHTSVGNAFGKAQFKTWCNIRVGDVLRPSGIDFANKTINASGSNANGNLITNAYLTVEYSERNVPTTKYNGKTVVTLGDSVTQNGGWTEGVSDLIGTNIINSGIGGNTTGDAVKRFDADVAAYSPDVVIIMFGINDCIYPPTTATGLSVYKNNLMALYNKCAAIGAKVVFMTPNEIKTGSVYDPYSSMGGMGTMYPKYIQAMKDVAAQTGSYLIDLYTPFYGKDLSKLLCDTVHPNAAGYAIYVDEISKYLLANQDSICG